MAKVLVVSYSPFSKTVNNGKTLSSFFLNYGVDNIAQLTFCGNDCNPEICNNYYFMSNSDALKGRLGRHVVPTEIMIVKPDFRKRGLLSRAFHTISEKRLPIAVLLKNLVWNRANYSGAIEWIKGFAPDIVFFQGFSSSFAYDFVLGICNKMRLPLILELTDDYTMNLYPWSVIGRYNNKRFIKYFAQAIKYSSKVIAISDAMKEEYSKRFDGNYDVIMNSVYTLTKIQQPRNSGDYVYTGNVLLNRWKVLCDFGKALHQVNPDAVLSIYTPDLPPQKALKAFKETGNIQYGGSLGSVDLRNRLMVCEYVVHVEAFDARNRAITRLSVSTKIPEYLASMAKLIAIGPDDVASIRFIKDNHLGLTICGNAVSDIAKELSREFDYQECFTNAKEYLKVFDQNLNRQKIRDYIDRALFKMDGEYESNTD